jgi:8-oxo-dGTP pyrophosphatase MutT (NUDIX family)
MTKLEKDINSIADFAPENTEAGVGLALQEDSGRYLFFLSGTRHNNPPGELFYAGIGGHREAGEDWLDCAQREAKEEIGTEVKILSAPITWYISQHGAIQKLEVRDRPRPLAFYEMIHPERTPRAGELYRIVIYQARLRDAPNNLPSDELLGIIALTVDEVIRGPQRRPTLAELVEEGGAIVSGDELVDRTVRLYPLGTAMALAQILRHEAG